MNTEFLTMKNKTLLRIIFLLLLAVVATVALRAQTPSPAQANILRPPAGAKVALVEFADLQCPDCARASALLEEASKSYKIPIVVYDFPLPQHNWSMEAAVLAHYLRTKSTKLNPVETKFRSYIYQNQSAITPQNLRHYIDEFAKANKITIPFVVDPQGKFAAEVRRDKDKGIAVNVQHTPTLYVVTAKSSGTPFVEVVDRTNLFAMIDQAIAETKDVTPARAPGSKKVSTAKK
jgi:protein-disulfide isomerase